jgi:hypothetical protein
MRHIVLLLVAVGVVFSGLVSVALATTPGWECVPTTAGQAVVSGGTGAAPSCSSGTPVLAPTYVSSGVGGKPTVQLSGVNLQVINGSGVETTVNGTGNLILGYDEKPGAQTGSHNLLLGGSGNSYTSYGGIVGGASNDTISGPYASILGGAGNTASGYASTISGGRANKTTTEYSTHGGGCSNLAGTGTLTVNSNCTTASTGYYASVTGGTGNQAEAENSSISGGAENKATGEESSVSGGSVGEASGTFASVLGGRLGKATYRASTVLGGLEEASKAEYGITPESKEGAPAPVVVVRARGTTPTVSASEPVPIPLTDNSWTQQADEDDFAFGGAVKVSWPPNAQCSVWVEVHIDGGGGLKTVGYGSGSQAKEETLHLEVEPIGGRGYEFETGETHTDTITAQTREECAEGSGHATVESVAVDGMGAT